VLLTADSGGELIQPAHSYKYLAALQAGAKSGGPFLLRTGPPGVEQWAWRLGFGAHFTGWGR